MTDSAWHNNLFAKFAQVVYKTVAGQRKTVTTTTKNCIQELYKVYTHNEEN